ncbi:MAG: hypothetical protein ACR2KZ_00375 [Segetibacter sp.]
MENKEKQQKKLRSTEKNLRIRSLVIRKRNQPPSGLMMGKAVSSNTACERNGETLEIKGTENWKLLDGGKILFIESTSVSTRGTFTVKAIYEKS